MRESQRNDLPDDTPAWMKKWQHAKPKVPLCKNEYDDTQDCADVEHAILVAQDIVEPRKDGKGRMVRTKERLLSMVTDKSVVRKRVDQKNAAKKQRTIPALPIVRPTYPLDSECRGCANGIEMNDELLGCNDEFIDAQRFAEYAFKGGCPKWHKNQGSKKPITEAPAPLRPGATLYARTPQQDDRPIVLNETPWQERKPDNFPAIGTRIGRWGQNTEATALIEYARTPYGLSRVKGLEHELARPLASKGKKRDVQEDARLDARRRIEREAFSFMNFAKDGADAYCPIVKKTFKVSHVTVLGDGMLRLKCPYCKQDHAARIGN